MAPSDLVGNVVDDVQAELNTVFNLDEILGSDSEHPTVDSEPVTITVEDDSEDEPGDDWGNADGTAADEDDTTADDGDE